MNDDNVFARRVKYRTANCDTPCGGSSTSLQGLQRQLRDVGDARFPSTKPKYAISKSRFLMVLAVTANLIVAIPTFEMKAESCDQCLARDGRKPIINDQDKSGYERRLFVTPDELARYVFLTNSYDGDRSAAIYRAPPKRGALPGDYWLTVTEAAHSLRGENLHRNIRVRRYDTPLPISVATALHRLWLRVLEQRPQDNYGIPSAPTGVFSVVNANGRRLNAVTVELKGGSCCLALLGLGELLIDYAKLPVSKRPHAVAEIEKDSKRLLKRVE